MLNFHKKGNFVFYSVSFLCLPGFPVKKFTQKTQKH